MEELVYYNGARIPISEVRIELDDRGYNFADGVYEVIAIYDHQPFKMAEHFLRLKESAQALEINFFDHEKLLAEAEMFIRQSQLAKISKLYVQITRGSEARRHAYSDHLTPNILMTVREMRLHPEASFQNGAKAITIADERWSRCYIKSTALLPNILGKKRAERAGVFEAIQIRDGFITEGTSSNLFIVKNQRILTPPATNYILNGITRQLVIAEAANLGYHVLEKSISVAELFAADEVFLTGTTTEIMPIVQIDGQTIGQGIVGSCSQKILQHYRHLYSNHEEL